MWKVSKFMNIIDSVGETFSDLRKFKDGFLTFNQRQNSHIPPTLSSTQYYPYQNIRIW